MDVNQNSLAIQTVSMDVGFNSIVEGETVSLQMNSTGSWHMQKK